MMRQALPLLAMLAMTGCNSRRLLVLETQVLRQENADLQRELAEARARGLDPEEFDRAPDLQTVARYLDRSGYNLSLIHI